MRSRLPSFLTATVLFAILAFGWSFVTGIENPLHSAAAAPEVTNAPPPEALVRGVRIEVLNGSGRPGVARRATRRLRDWGFDVVYIGNARNFGYEKTEVLLRQGSREAADAVARALTASHVEAAPDTTLALEITVILGADYVAPDARPELESAARVQ